MTPCGIFVPKNRPQGSNFLRLFCAYFMDIFNKGGYKRKRGDSDDTKYIFYLDYIKKTEGKSTTGRTKWNDWKTFWAKQRTSIVSLSFTINEVIVMTLNILFLSITIKKREMSIEEAAHQEQIKKIYEETKNRQISVHRIMY
jgi:uncharacterized protein (TIGR02413 family)